MPFIDEIPLGEIKVFGKLSEASLGDLLQFDSTGDTTCVGMKCSYPMPNGEIQGIVCLDGPLSGTFFDDEHLRNRPAVAISRFASVVLREPAPSRARRVAGGDFCQFRLAADGPIFQGIAVKGSNGNLIGYVPLTGERRGRIGNVQDDPLYLGRAGIAKIEIQTKSHPVSAGQAFVSPLVM